MMKGENFRIKWQHVHAPIHVFDARRFDEGDETNDDELACLINRYKLCSIPNEKAHPTLSSLLKEVQTHHHTTFCRKKIGITCCFSAPWPLSKRTLIVRGRKDIDENLLTKRKKVLDRV